MEFEFTEDGIVFERILSPLDEFTIAFTRILDRVNVRYVLISGYVAILFGRSRSSEDVDVFIEHLSKERFLALWNELSKEFECIITNKWEQAYDEYLMDGGAIRFALPGQYVPNMEVKFAKTGVDEFALQQRVRVFVNNFVLYVSSLEMQIPYKLLLGSGKDIEDARHLYSLFKRYIDVPTMLAFMHKIDIPADALQVLE
jgi:hypothetical protein